MTTRVEPPIPDRRFKVVRGSPKGTYCRHYAQAILDEENRTVTCSACKVVLDPFTYLLRWSEQEAEWVRREKAAHDLEALLRWIMQSRGRVSIGKNGIAVFIMYGGREISRRRSMTTNVVTCLAGVIEDLSRQIDWKNRAARAKDDAGIEEAPE